MDKKSITKLKDKFIKTFKNIDINKNYFRIESDLEDSVQDLDTGEIGICTFIDDVKNILLMGV